jgi:hypothetical protein
LSASSPVELFYFAQTFNCRRVTLCLAVILQSLLGPLNQMEFLAKSRIATALVVVAASSVLFAQSGGPDGHQDNATTQDALHIVGRSIGATERSLQVRDRYTYVERDQDRRLDVQGQLKSEKVAVTRMILVNGARFEQLMERNGQLPSAEEQKKLEQDFEKLKHETPEERTARLAKVQENRSLLRDVLEGFDFRLICEEVLGSRPAYVFQATPHPGYHARGNYDKMFSKVEGKLWIDKSDFGWIKVEAQVTQPFSMGLFVARVQRGSHITLEQTNVGNGVWMPQRLEVRASAKILLLKGLNIERILTYSDYCPEADCPYSVSR